MKGQSLSPVKVRKIWTNENSTKDQVTVQFAQQIKGSSNKLVALAQGFDSTGNTATALLSFKSDVALRLFGTTDADYSAQPFETWPDANTAMGMKLEIAVVENTTQNPATPNQSPKVNPRTAEVLTLDGAPIYRHTELAVAGEAKREFVQHNGVAAPKNAEVNALQAIAAQPELETLAM